MTDLQKMTQKWVTSSFRYVVCEVCKTGKFGAIEINKPCCDNPKCKLYDGFMVRPCHNCRVTRRECCC